jgi:Cu-processing system ATP-binding protein
MRQRLGLAQALLGDPRLLILDEPTTGLDPALRHQFFDILRSFGEAGVTIVISSHALTEIEARADRYVILQHGQMAASGTLEELQREAGLPVRIRLTLPPEQVLAALRDIPEGCTARPAGEGRIELICPESRKMELLREIMASGLDVLDIEMRSSRLDDIYAHFAIREERR